MNVGKLPKDVWEAARLIWENTPDISDRELLDRLKEIYKDKAPKSHTTIGRKRKAENWIKKSVLDGNVDAPIDAPKKKTRTKNAPRRPKKNAGNTDKSSKDNNETVDAPNEKNAPDDAPKNAPTSTALTIWKETEQKIYAESEKLILDNHEKAKIIHKHRKRVKKIGEMQDKVLDTINILDGLDLDDKESGEKITKVLIIADTTSKVLTNLVVSQKTLFEQEMTVCGIKMTDFEMSEQERRIEGLKQLDGLVDEQRAIRNEKLAALRQRLNDFETLSVDELAAMENIDMDSDYGNSEDEVTDD